MNEACSIGGAFVRPLAARPSETSLCSVGGRRRSAGPPIYGSGETRRTEPRKLIGSLRAASSLAQGGTSSWGQVGPSACDREPEWCRASQEGAYFVIFIAVVVIHRDSASLATGATLGHTATLQRFSSNFSVLAAWLEDPGTMTSCAGLRSYWCVPLGRFSSSASSWSKSIR